MIKDGAYHPYNQVGRQKRKDRNMDKYGMKLLILTILSIMLIPTQVLFCQETEYLGRSALFSSEKRPTSRELNHLSEQLFNIGDYKTGLQFHDIAETIVNSSYYCGNNSTDSSKIKGYSSFPAKEYIIERSKQLKD